MDQLGDIAAFHEKFDLVYEGEPHLMSQDTRVFRMKFLAEELRELGEALGFNVSVWIQDVGGPVNLHEAFDALIDLDYVLKGTVYLMGLRRAFPEGWRRVHAANMAKVRATAVEDSKRKSKLDVVKPPGWTAPDLSDLLL